MVGTALGDDMVLAIGPLFGNPLRRMWTNTNDGRAASAPPFSSMSKSVTCPRSSKWIIKAASGMGEGSVIVGSCSMVAPPCFADVVARNLARATGQNVSGIRACSPPMPWSRAARTFETRASASSSVSIKTARFVAEYGRPVAWAAAGALPACPVKIDIVKCREIARVQHAVSH